MGIVALGFAAVIILAALAVGKGGTSLDRVPEFVRKVIADSNASRDDLLQAAKLSDESGYPQLGEVLRQKAEGAKKLIESPWKDVTSSAWTRFASTVAGPYKVNSINPKGMFGLFQLTVRRLTDLGIMSEPKKTNGAWTGTWVVPMEKFLTDATLQYATFARSMDLYRAIIAEKYKQVIGATLEGKLITLSGLLAVAHMAGAEGLGKWIVDPEQRKRFEHVTAAYKQATGIF